MAILAAASAALSLAKKVIPQHTIVGKAIGSTNTSKGIDLGKVAKDAGFEKLGSTLTSLGALGSSTAQKASAATGTAPGSVAMSLTNIPASQALLSGNLTGGTSASTFQTIGQSTAPASSSSPGSDKSEPSKDENKNKMFLYAGAAALVYFMFIKK